MVAIERRTKVRDSGRPSFSTEAPRRLEIFLDYLLSLSTSTTAFLLNPLYDAILEENQRTLRGALLHFIHEVRPS